MRCPGQFRMPHGLSLHVITGPNCMSCACGRNATKAQCHKGLNAAFAGHIGKRKQRGHCIDTDTFWTGTPAGDGHTDSGGGPSGFISWGPAA